MGNLEATHSDHFLSVEKDASALETESAGASFPPTTTCVAAWRFPRVLYGAWSPLNGDCPPLHSRKRAITITQDG